MDLWEKLIRAFLLWWLCGETTGEGVIEIMIYYPDDFIDSSHVCLLMGILTWSPPASDRTDNASCRLRYKARYSPEPLDVSFSQLWISPMLFQLTWQRPSASSFGVCFSITTLTFVRPLTTITPNQLLWLQQREFVLETLQCVLYSLDSLFGISIVQGYLYFIDNDDQWPLRLFVIIKLISGFGLSPLMI